MLGFIIFLIGSTFFIVLGNKSRNVALIMVSKREKDYLHQYFSRHFNFYKQLNPSNQQKFIYRVVVMKSVNKIKVDKAIKIAYKDIDLLISAAFTQITFGYSDFRITSFSKIVVYPDSFYSKLAGSNVNGLTVGNGFIYFSWNHFIRGYQNNTDKVNLALHELAHALYIDRFHFRSDYNWFEWEEQAAPVFRQIKNNDEITFFRNYAKTNMAEFWAVCVECFFEDPENFNIQFPDLYRATSLVLKQDLLKISNTKTLFY
jgi:Mlc titration factor MtfA (ptsG expression regulator)